MNTLNRLETVSGDYGLYIKVKYTDEINTTASQEKTFNFSQNDMYGDVYNFTTYFSQEAVFNISDVGNITSIEAFLYQGSNFKRIKSSGDGKDNYELIPNKIIEKNTINNNDYISEAKMEPNIFVNNIEISLGYDLNNFDSDAVIVYTLNSTQYSSSDSAEARKREIQARWVHKTDDGFISVEQDKLNEYNAQIHWYRYQLDEKATYDDFGGKYWVPIKDNNGAQSLDQNNIYKCYIKCDPAVQDENVKAVISLPSAERNDYLQDVSTELGKGAMVSTDEIDGLTKALKEAPNKLTNDDVLEQIQLLIDTYEKITNPNETQQKFLKYLNQIEEEISGLPCIDLYSDIVQIHNTTQVQARLAVDLVQAVSITVGDEKDPYKGVYMIYGENGEIMNSSISAQRQKLVLSYGSLLTGLNEFDGDGTELVSWRFPLTNTMIRTPTEGVEYNNENFDYNGDTIPAIRYVDDNGNAPTKNNPATWAIISRKIEKLDETDEKEKTKIGGFAVKTSEQIFRIKDYYTSVGRNTIYCEINKGGYIYVAEITLIFGVAGTSGTDYTLRIIPSTTAISYDETAKTSQITLTAHVYDYNNQEVRIKSIDYSFVSPNSLDTALTKIPDDFHAQFKTITGSTTDTIVEVDFKPAEVNNSKYYVIVKASAQIDALDINTYLTAFLPLSWSSNLSDYNHFEGPDKVIYSAQGSNPFYYKNNFALYNQLDKEVSGITWTLEAYNTDLSYDEETKQYKPAKKFYPSVLVNNSLYSLKVPSMYIKENYLCRLVGKIKDDIVWIQPLYIAQNAYNSPLLNNWDETVSIDEEGGTIMAPMIGAGKKNADNQFSGVLMGDVKKADNDISLTGLYGYQNGIQTFSLTEDGRAKFGASGNGQIQIDGNRGIIQSGNYAMDNKTGMLIELEKGHIDAYNFELNSKYVSIDSNEDANNYFTVRGSGTISSTTYVYEDNLLNINNTKTEDHDVFNKILMNVGNSSYYLQTLDYNATSNKEAGMRWDLMSGKLRAYGGFNLEAINHRVKVNSKDGDAQETNYPNIYVEIDMKQTSDEYSISKITRYNYKNYYFTLIDGNKKDNNGNEIITYYNDWDHFTEAPFNWAYSLVMNVNQKEYLKTGKNYSTIFETYYFGYINEKIDPWNGDMATLKDVILWKPITKENWKVDNAYFKLDKIVSLDKTKKYKQELDGQSVKEKTIDKLFKKVNDKNYVLIGTTSNAGGLKIGSIEPIKNADNEITGYKITKNGNAELNLNLDVANCFYWNANKKEFSNVKTIDTSATAIYSSVDGSLTLKTVIKNLNDIYIKTGSYYKGILSINADAGQYPLQLKLGDEVPFKLSWAGYLHTTRLQAIGGTIGGWEITKTGLASSNKKIKLNNSEDETLEIYYNNDAKITYTGPYIKIGETASNSSIKSYPKLSDKAEITQHAEGSFTNDDINKYYKKSENNYYQIIKTTPPYYELTTSTKNGISMLGDGRVIAKNLYIEGGDGQWGGTAARAKYSETTNQWGHTHPLSGQKTVITTTGKDWMRKIDDGASDINKIIMYDIANYTITCDCSGDTNKGLTISATVSPNIGSKYIYYTPNAYNHATATQSSSAVTYYKQTRGFLNRPIYSKVSLKAQRTGESEIEIIEV